MFMDKNNLPLMFQHYKNKKFYSIIGMGVDTTTNDHTSVVFYRQSGAIAPGEDSSSLTFSRAAKDFFGSVMVDGKEIPRFRMVQG